MKERTGNECKKTNCKNYKFYSNWFSSMGCHALEECINCKHSHVSQYVAGVVKQPLMNKTEE